MTEFEIQSELDKTIGDWAKLQSPIIPVIFQNKAYDPVIGTTYIKTCTQSGGCLSPSIGDGHKRFVGIYEINIYTPENKGTKSSFVIASAIEALFPRGDHIPITNGDIFFDYHPSAGSGSNPSPGWYMVTVSVTYRADTFN